ncbi:hypothetical protein ARAM_001728 [Aspergillus rambellii]|uniref:Uncharacterized protein n=1 Tax=Aspergillus rambellii TaxID=308745 RepID=A0A0F8W6P1_9EURO|nr:hypothetical protein ARAM_001728 [Aspergillus rambellii]
MVSAPDVITYVGVPLAVLGVLPIFYTCMRSIIALRSIQRVLKANGLGDTAIARGSLMSGIVEVEIPRRRIAPLDRELDPAYWTLNPHQISLPGGTWAIFSWNQILTGRTMYRCQYKEELRVPPAEISFEELVAFLLDRGAVPDAKGWKVLKSIGLWTPTGTTLLRAPVDGSPVLRLAPPYDGDGILRLAVFWKSAWDRRNMNNLPPFWMRLVRPIWEEDVDTQHILPIYKGDVTPEKSPGLSRKSTGLGSEAHSGNGHPPPTLLAQIQERHKSGSNRSLSDGIRFHAVEGYVHSVYFEHAGIPTGETEVLWNVGRPDVQWFGMVASALSQKSDSGLWNVSIPTDIMGFAKGSIPGGIMVVLGLLSEDEIPPFTEPPPNFEVDPLERHQRFLDGQKQRALESRMPPAQAEEARRQRLMAETQSFHNESLRLMKARKEYEDRRIIAALNSQPLVNAVVAEKNRLYLIKTNHIPDNYTLDDLVKAVLYLMVVDQEAAQCITSVLDRWHEWTQRSGVNQQDLDFLKENKIWFCYASAMIAIVVQADRSESQAAVDMMECLKIWQTVHLG